MKNATSDLPSASLYYREGSSDKEYHASVKPRDGGFVVEFAYGRRGSTLQSGLKTAEPVSLATASMIFQKLVAAKEAKGYVRGGNGHSPQLVPSAQALAPSTPNGGTPSRTARPRIGAIPQLLNELPEDDVELFIRRAGDQWGAQEKYDGKNVTLTKFEFAVQATNRVGQACGVSLAIANHAASLDGEFVIMGEALGNDQFAAHNVVDVDGVDCRGSTYQSRYDVVRAIVGTAQIGAPIFIVGMVTGAEAIMKYYRHLKKANAEGMVLKDLNAPHTEGRPASGGSQLKVKFWASCSCIVGAINTQRSVAVQLGDKWMGNVTIPPNYQIPAVGAIVEVRYLYAFKGGSLYQPIYRGERDDVKAADCTVEKQRIKFKKS